MKQSKESTAKKTADMFAVIEEIGLQFKESKKSAKLTMSDGTVVPLAYVDEKFQIINNKNFMTLYSTKRLDHLKKWLESRNWMYVVDQSMPEELSSPAGLPEQAPEPKVRKIHHVSREALTFKQTVKDELNSIPVENLKIIEKIAKKFDVDYEKYEHLQNGLRKMNLVNSIAGEVSRMVDKGLKSATEISKMIKY